MTSLRYSLTWLPYDSRFLSPADISTDLPQRTARNGRWDLRLMSASNGGVQDTLDSVIQANNLEVYLFLSQVHTHVADMDSHELGKNSSPRPIPNA